SSGRCTTSISPLSLHDALPISTPMAITKMAGKARMPTQNVFVRTFSTYSRCATSQVLLVMGLGLLGAGLFHRAHEDLVQARLAEDRKSTRLNSSHRTIPYDVFC